MHHRVDVVVHLSNLVASIDLDKAPGQEAPIDVVVQRQKQNRLKPEEIDRLVAMYESGSSVNQLAELVKIHRTTVMAHLKRRGIPTRPTVRALTDEQVQEVIKLYKGGLSTAAIAIRYDVNPGTIRNELIRADVPRRSPGRFS